MKIRDLMVVELRSGKTVNAKVTEVQGYGRQWHTKLRSKENGAWIVLFSCGTGWPGGVVAMCCAEVEQNIYCYRNSP